MLTALLRTRKRLAAALGERGWLLEREREAAARAAVGAERARIARELHDIVSHTVSVMVVQASAAREVLNTMPDEAATALRAVQDAGRGALTELRHLLGLLAPDADGQDGATSQASAHDQHGATSQNNTKSQSSATSQGSTESQNGVMDQYGTRGHDLEPQPSLSRLSALVDRVAFAGLPVEVRISGEPRPLPAGVDLTAYRIVQEGLTNALKYGGGGKAEVTVRYADRSLRVEVLNTGPSVLKAGPAEKPAKTTGRGLTGLRARVAVYGGDLDARRRLGGGYRVRARIPLDPP
ncbi:histidine kinase [Dactylosporangium sp. NPDC050588]|uniref:sensor histidine kinase n=1 Tax=Dactylosporangium sp. NPDC050588 TaxID=3157211 RepID=UPI003408250F